MQGKFSNQHALLLNSSVYISKKMSGHRTFAKCSCTMYHYFLVGEGMGAMLWSGRLIDTEPSLSYNDLKIKCCSFAEPTGFKYHFE